MCANEKGSTLQRGTVSPDLSVTYCSVVALVVDAAVVLGCPALLPKRGPMLWWRRRYRLAAAGISNNAAKRA